MAEPLIEISDLRKQFKRGKLTVDVLDDLNLTVDKGDFIALMGPSGSGKSTLLNLIGGLDRPTSGSVIVGGTNIHALSQRDLTRWRAANVGFVFQFYNLLPVLTAQMNVELPLLLTNLGRTERRFRAQTALDMVGLESRSSHKPAELSGGQQQRVAIARALVTDPLILLCDEPTGDLDRESADDVLSLLQLVNRDHGKTVVMVTHDPRAADHAHGCLHMDKGALIPAQDGQPA